jgi:diguanylate cyclase (GGDEF)-like protein
MCPSQNNKKKCQKMIEILCIAAEITAVLLILSIALPTSATKQIAVESGADASHVDSKLLQNCEDSLLALRSLLYLQASQTVGAIPRDQKHSDAYSEVIHRLRDHLESIEPLNLSATTDSVTKLVGRAEFEKLLAATATWTPLIDVSTWVGLIQIDKLDELDDAHGPMASELMLREAANFLRERIGGIGPLARYNHCGFVIALHGWSQTAAIELLESVRRGFQQHSVTVGDSTISTTASASTMSLDLALSFDASWERLEDGIAEAITKGANRGRWFNAADSTWQPMGPETEPSEGHSRNESADREESDESPQSEAVVSNDTEPATSQAGEPSDNATPGLKDEDIASLFKAAKESKLAKPPAASNVAPAEAPTAAPTPPAVQSPAPIEESDSPSDIQDDIAALFKAARAVKAPSGAPSEVASTNTAKKPTEEPDDAAPAATNDDIESLFAAFKKPKNPK